MLKNAWIGILLAGLLGLGPARGHAAPGVSTAAVEALLREAKGQYDQAQYEQAAASLERALRIEAGNPVLWHNLAGVRLQQQDWPRAISLAAKSNALAVGDRMLRIRNWIIIGLACDGMGDKNCSQEARKRIDILATQH